MIRHCTQNDFDRILAIINEAAQAYRGIIPDDRWKDPYMPAEELADEIAAGVVFDGYEIAGAGLVGLMGRPDGRGRDTDSPRLCGTWTSAFGGLDQHCLPNCARAWIVRSW